MVAKLNHTIVVARDKDKSAAFLAEVLGLPAPQLFGQFVVVTTGNDVSLDFADTDGEIAAQHYAFLIDEDAFDEIFSRVQERGITFWPNPWRGDEGTINYNDGGRGFYFEDPSGHFLEVLTRPYGNGS